MADSKITALAALTAADPANDMVPIVDVSDNSMAASGTTKRISINNILACSPSATLASLNVTGSSIPANGLYLPTTNTLEFSANSLAQYRIAPLGVFSWFDGAGGTRMTLNSTGLGVGGSPAYKVSAIGTTNNQVILHVGNTAGSTDGDTTNVVRFAAGSGANALWANARYDGFSHSWRCNSTTTQAMTLDASGRLLVNTTGVASAEQVSITASNAGYQCLYLRNTASSQTATFFVANSVTAATSSFSFADWYANGVAQFRVSGNGVIYAQNTAVQSISDVRLKENISNATDGLDVITALRPVRYDWKAGFGNERKQQLGFIAQEVQAVFADAVGEWELNGETYKTVGPSALIPVLVKAVQELAAEVNALKNA